MELPMTVKGGISFMKGTLILESGEKISVDYNEEDFSADKKRLTGMEKVIKSNTYYFINGEGLACKSCDLEYDTDKKRYEAANYYSDKKLCEADACADTLMRKIRKYARERNNFKTMNDVSVRVFYDFHYGLGISNYKNENYATKFHNLVSILNKGIEKI